MKSLIFPEKVQVDFVVLQQKLVLWTPSTEEPGQSVLDPGVILITPPLTLYGDICFQKLHRNTPEHTRSYKEAFITQTSKATVLF